MGRFKPKLFAKKFIRQAKDERAFAAFSSKKNRDVLKRELIKAGYKPELTRFSSGPTVENPKKRTVHAYSIFRGYRKPKKIRRVRESNYMSFAGFRI
jgi:hypothetical protein